MSQNPPSTVRRTKKSSFRPLSKLSGDNLTELTRVDKPEYTKRVFFYNTSSRARLQNSVNVWFRDHLHTMALINRKQRAVCKLMCRVQKDQHHARREEYKRKQQEMRSSMKRLQVELLQRRVIQRFRRNAQEKMASRGQESLAGQRLQSQRRPSKVDDPDLTPDEPQSAARRMLGSIIVDFTAALDSAGLDPVGDNDDEEVQDEAKASSAVSSAPLRPEPDGQGSESGEGCAASPTDRDKRGDSKSRQNNDSELAGPAQAASTTTAPASEKKTASSSRDELRRGLEQRETDGDRPTPSAKDPAPAPASASASQDVGPLAQRQTAAKSRVAKLSVAATESLPLDVIPEVRTPPPRSPVPGDAHGAYASGPEEKFRVPVSGKVLEVRKKRPNSPSTRTVNARTRRKTYATLPAYDPSNIKGEESKEETQVAPEADRKQHTDDQDSKGGSFHCSANLNPIPFSSLLTSVAHAETANTHRSEVATAARDFEEIRDEKKSVSFSYIPSREEVARDAAIFLAGSGEEEVELDAGYGVGREGEVMSLAARIKLERKYEARRRAKLLDSEPLVQYYRSARGALQPLLTEPTRRSYPLPSGRLKYQQTKMLREEQQKDLARRDSIDKFFSDLFDRQIGDPKTQSQDDSTGKKPKSPPQGNQLQLLLQRMMRKPSAAPGRVVEKNSVEQLARCQYLRLYDGLSRTDKSKDSGESGEKVTSWATAEKGLKAGFLAFDYTGQGS